MSTTVAEMPHEPVHNPTHYMAAFRAGNLDAQAMAEWQQVRDAVAECYLMAHRGCQRMYSAFELDCLHDDEHVRDDTAELIEVTRVQFVLAFDQLDALIRPLGIHIDDRYKAINDEIDADSLAWEQQCEAEAQATEPMSADTVGDKWLLLDGTPPGVCQMRNLATGEVETFDLVPFLGEHVEEPATPSRKNPLRQMAEARDGVG